VARRSPTSEKHYKWRKHNDGETDMNIASIFAGLLSIFTANETVDISQKVYSALNTVGNIIEKSEKNEWKASMHEEGYQILKDAIREAGK